MSAFAPSVVVFDCETQDKIDNMPGVDRNDQVRALEVSCLSYTVLNGEEVLASPERANAEAERSEVTTLWRDVDETGEGPFEPMLKAFDEAEVIASFNGLGFDHLLLWKYYKGDKQRYQEHQTKTHDMFARLRESTTIWYKLDDLLKANGVPTKTANGLLAIKWWADGERDLLQEYCEADVRCLAKLLVQPRLALPRSKFVVENYTFGAASALAAALESRRIADALANGAGLVASS
jgi:hypothetical protein